MGDLRDELRKAGLLKDKDVKRLSHEDRVQRKQLGHEGLKHQEEEKRHQHQARIEEQKEHDRDLERQKKDELSKKERQAKLRDLIEGNQIKEGIRGTQRFYFVTRNGHIPYMEVDPSVGRRLESGEWAIVELPGEPIETFVLVKGSVVPKIRELDRGVVLFFGPDLS